jgi:hypothetical protein
MLLWRFCHRSADARAFVGEIANFRPQYRVRNDSTSRSFREAASGFLTSALKYSPCKVSTGWGGLHTVHAIPKLSESAAGAFLVCDLHDMHTTRAQHHTCLCWTDEPQLSIKNRDGVLHIYNAIETRHGTTSWCQKQMGACMGKGNSYKPSPHTINKRDTHHTILAAPTYSVVSFRACVSGCVKQNERRAFLLSLPVLLFHRLSS